MLRCGSVRFSDVGNPAVRFSVIFEILRCGSARFPYFNFVKPTVQFSRGKNPTVRCDAAKRIKPHRTDTKNPRLITVTENRGGTGRDSKMKTQKVGGTARRVHNFST